MAVDAGAPINVSDFAEDLDILSERADDAQAATLALATSVIAYFGALSSCVQHSSVTDTPDGGARIAITFNATMPDIPTVVACLGDHTIEQIVEVEAGSVTTDGCNVFVFDPDGTFGTDLVRINWHAICDFPDTSGISG